MNLKPYYDAAVEADNQVQSVLNNMDELLQGGKKDEALALRPQLEEAKAKSKEANDIYTMMRDGAESMGSARNFVPASNKPEVNANQAMTRKDFFALDDYAKAEFVRNGGIVTE